MFARQKPLETVIYSYFSTKKRQQLKSLVQHFHYPLSPSVPSQLLPHRRCSPPQNPDAPFPRTRLHFLLSPCGAAVVMYQLQLTASQVGPRDVSDHREAARLAQRPDFRPRPQLRPCPRQGRETPGQTTETLPAADCLMLATDRIQAKGGERAAAIPRTFL